MSASETTGRTVNAERVVIEPVPAPWRNPLVAGFLFSIGGACGISLFVCAAKLLGATARWLGLA
jgi:hypothetical protein